MIISVETLQEESSLRPISVLQTANLITSIKAKEMPKLLMSGLAIIGGLSIAFWILQEFVFSYRGLTATQVNRIYHEMDRRYSVLSRTCGTMWDGGTFCRGIYTARDGGSGYPLYYRYEYHPADGSASFDMYPLLMERWTTGPDWFGHTGSVVLPKPSSQ